MLKRVEAFFYCRKFLAIFRALLWGATMRSGIMLRLTHLWSLFASEEDCLNDDWNFTSISCSGIIYRFKINSILSVNLVITCFVFVRISCTRVHHLRSFDELLCHFYGFRLSSFSYEISCVITFCIDILPWKDFSWLSLTPHDVYFIL